jgi:5-formyltetrahydrofolate cyclo-ligase
VAAPGTATKQQIRARVSASRKVMPGAVRDAAARAVTRVVLDLLDTRPVSTPRISIIAAYVSFGTEPATPDLLDALRSRRLTVLLPVLRDDLDLDWAAYDGAERLVPGARGLGTPTGPRLGVDAIGTADLVLVPALAVDERGQRLGRGGGSYDRALARVPDGRPVVALLYDGEVLPEVPAEAHDRPVTAAATPAGLRRFA